MTMTPRTYARQYWKQWLISLSIAALGVAFLASLGGCSTVSGLARDLGAVSDIAKKAMAQD